MARAKRETKPETLAFPVQVATKQGAWLEFDGKWSAFDIQVGSEHGGQTFAAVFSTSSFSTWLPTADSCNLAQLTTTNNFSVPAYGPSSQTNCAISRGVGALNGKQSNGYVGSRDDSDTFKNLGPPGYANIGPDLNASSLFGPEYYYTFYEYEDNVFLTSSNSPGVQIGSGAAVPVLGDNGWFYYLPTVGLGFGKYRANDTDTLMTSLAKNGSIPSQTWGYTAGAYYRNGGYDGSLTLGGYDAERIVANTTGKFEMPAKGDTTELRLSVKTISIDFNVDSDHPNPNESSSSFTAVIDSTLPYLILDPKLCQWVADQYGLVWDNVSGLYALDSSRASANKAATKKISFVLGKESDDSNAVPRTTIEFSYGAFMADASWTWLWPDQQSIFPMRNKTSSDPDVPAVLGRAFLQEAYLFANYEHADNDGMYFEVSQAAFPSPYKTNITSVQASTTPPPPKSGLSTAAIIAISVVIPLIVIAAAIGTWWFCVRKKKKNKRASKDSTQAFPEMEESPTEYRPDHPRRDTVDSSWSGVTADMSELSALSPRPPLMSELSGDTEVGKGLPKIHEMGWEDDRDLVDKSEAARLEAYAAAMRTGRGSGEDVVAVTPLAEMQGSDDWLRP